MILITIKKLRLSPLIVAAFIPSIVFADTITCKADPWFPYNGEPNSDMPGYVIEIATKAFKEAGHTFKYEKLNWSRTVRGVGDGTVDCAIGASYGDTPKAVFPKEELGVMINSFVKPKDSDWKYSGVQSLKNKTIGIIKDYSYGKEIDDLIKEKKHFKSIEALSGELAITSNLKKVAAKRIDVYIEDCNVSLAMIRKMGLQDKLTVNCPKKFDKSNYMFISFTHHNKNSKKWAEILSKTVEKMKKNGELKKLLAKYGLTYWKK